jgi:hypothetical protein
MSRRRRILLLGVALVALAFVGTVAVVLWPLPPSEAEQKAELIRVGMPRSEVNELLGSSTRWTVANVFNGKDGSQLVVVFPHRLDLGHCVVSFHTIPPPPVHPLTRLRRTLARALPFLGE